ncbi:MAG: hypothetical protein ACJA2X_000877 [Halocynthiibacter sp.]|jgi:hypothetical protein
MANNPVSHPLFGTNGDAARASPKRETPRFDIH